MGKGEGQGNGEDAIEMLKVMLRMFLQKYSSCFYLTILRAIKHQILHTKTPKKLQSLLTNPKL